MSHLSLAKSIFFGNKLCLNKGLLTVTDMVYNVTIIASSAVCNSNGNEQIKVWHLLPFAYFVKV